jgi:hypothetical protein
MRFLRMRPRPMGIEGLQAGMTEQVRVRG